MFESYFRNRFTFSNIRSRNSRRIIQAKKEKNAKFMALQRQMESSHQRQMRLQDISDRKICSQLETLEKKAIIYLFFNFFTLVIFMKVTLHHIVDTCVEFCFSKERIS